MLLEKFKQGKENDLVKAIQKYIANHFGMNYLYFRGCKI